MTYQAWVEVELDVLAANIGLLRSMVGEALRILMVVKADAYGHGAVEVSRVAEENRVDFLGVATLHEGIEIRRSGVTLPILILSPSLPGEARDIVAYDLRATVSSAEMGRALARAARRRGTVAPIHLEVDTGMGRAGLPPREAGRLVHELTALGGIKMEGVFTHFPSADGPDQSFTRSQLERFALFRRGLEEEGVSIPLAHAANSGAILGAPETWLDMVRSGLLLYGMAPNPGAARPEGFRTVMSFRSRVVHLRWLEPGETVSYGCTYKVPRRCLVATVAAGYGHGLPWKLGNRGQVLVRGRRAPVVGRVTMDLTMIDVTHLEDVAVGDEVVLFGEQGEGRIDLHEVASWAETLVYEIICGLGKRVVRTYHREGRATRAMTMVGEEVL